MNRPSLSSNLNAYFVDSIDDVEKTSWNNLLNNNYPFLQYEFIAALEHSGATSETTGWIPHHLIIQGTAEETATQTEKATSQAPAKIIAIIPLYIKNHSYGEYVFDWSWADAYQQHGISYYPKLITCIPFTPATGPRILFSKDYELADLADFSTEVIKAEAIRLKASSWHCLFPQQDLHEHLEKNQIASRIGCQFHWINKDYSTFDNFLANFTSRKRKNINKERKRVKDQNLELTVKIGDDISTQEWQSFYQFYHYTYFKRSGRQGYLNEQFFTLLAKNMASQIMMVTATHQDILVATALFFIGDDTLYGRYWGCQQEFECLHFEACYYQGIEFAIQQGLSRFDPGAQGEHKIQRGFTPTMTYSNHWIAHPEFRSAINRFLIQERKGTLLYIEDGKTYLPFKKDLKTL